MDEAVRKLRELNDNARRFWKNHKWGGCEPEDFPQRVEGIHAVMSSIVAHLESLSERLDRLESLEEEW